MPAAAHVEKDGTFTNTQRLRAVARQGARPAGRRALGAVVHAPPVQARAGALRGLDARRATGRSVNLTWDYAEHGPHREPDAEEVLRGDQRLRPHRPASWCPASRSSKADGTHRLRLLDLLRRLRRRRQPGAPARPRRPRRAAAAGSRPSGRWAWPANRRMLYNRASAPTRRASRGRSARSYVWWDEDAGQVDRLRRPGLPGRQAAGLPRRRRTPRAWTRSAATTRSS